MLKHPWMTYCFSVFTTTLQVIGHGFFSYEKNKFLKNVEIRRKTLKNLCFRVGF
jgi:hypothetical protein